jgi:phosphate transport system permease protein
MMEKLYFRRRARNAVALSLSFAATAFGLFWLVWILWTALFNGLSAINGALFTQMTPPPGSDGGLLNAFFGSLVMSGLAILIGAPIGIAAGTYLAEYARKRALGEIIRFVNDILLSAPSIVLGLFVYTVVVRTMGHFSGLAGALALALIVIPVVVRTTDEMLQLVPSAMREASLSLGVPQWKMTLQVLYRAAAPGILTGILLALARISGETAPLLFTALSNPGMTTNMSSPMATLPVVIYNFAGAPYADWQKLAWAGAFLITFSVLVLNIIARSFAPRTRN